MKVQNYTLVSLWLLWMNELYWKPPLVLGRMEPSHPEQGEQTTIVHVEQDVPEPIPPVIVDQARLKHILQLATKMSNNFMVDQLEKLYSLLSQCIYHHRKEYDKTHLLEEMENLLKTFHTFLWTFEEEQVHHINCFQGSSLLSHSATFRALVLIFFFVNWCYCLRYLEQTSLQNQTGLH